ncbi:Josephin-2 [Halotydeus destructor]|nr:Josephin-2 [Halotydeus destructor]
MSDELYHEKQSRQLCAMHALNNLFQEEAFTQKDLDDLCQSLAPECKFINPHKSPLGLGNYDVNVLMSAVQSKNHEAVWFDKRKEPEQIVLENVKGFILNIPNSSTGNRFVNLIYLPLSVFMSRKHWISVVKKHDVWHNVDSKLPSPQAIGDNEKLFHFLREKKENESEIFVIVEKQVSLDHSWLSKN